MSPFQSFFNFRFAALLILSVFFQKQALQAQGCGCTNCPQFMPDNFVGDFTINVMGATNNQLGQNGQGVCGVNIHFDHEYLGDLSIVLTSPSGQSVTLVGPIGFFGPTDFTSWDVSFVPCGDVANPDPGFSAQWNNNQAWGTFGNYTGSYYPASGCLENFNSGSVNGTWTLTVTDGQAIDVGNFLDYEIIFCDPSGINCFSCAAEAGDLPQADISACQYSPNLSLNLPPTYTLPQVEPDPALYSYTYVISGAGGVILAYEDAPDLTSYDPGVYNVCGFSYYTDEASLIPPPNGSLTITQLTNSLASNQPPLCGDITGNCVNVTINASPPDEEEYITLCAPQCYFFHNQTYCQTGTYVRTLTSPQGCPYTATLFLTVNQASTRNINETVCVGECSTTPGFEANCSPGNYQEIFMNYLGCDSIVNLNLQVLNVIANIAPPADLSCSTPTILVQGNGSTTGSGTTYFWTASNGGHIIGSNLGLTITVDQPGDYQLRVCRNAAGAFCCDSTSVTVHSTQTPPAPPASIAGLTTLCQGVTTTYTATTVSDATSYIWTVPAGVTINSGQNTQTINVTWNSPNGGNVCVSSSNNCGTSQPTCLAVSVTPAVVPGIPSGNASVCAGATENYSITPIADATNYTWTVTGGTISSGQGTPSIVVNWGSTNGNVCVNATGPCGTSQDICLPVTVTAIPAMPVVAGPFTTCPGDSVMYTVGQVAGATTYNWVVTNGTIVSGQGNDTVRVAWNATALNGVICANAANTCGNSPDSCKTVNLSIPVAGQINHTCDATNQFYTVTFPITGGTPPYTVTGGTVTGNVFTSGQIPNGLPYTFTVLDTNMCASAVITGNFDCNCTTNAGTMDLTPLATCEGGTVTATHLGDQTLDGNDVTAFVLHSNSGTSLGTVFGQNTSGTFGFAPGMTYETTYYISLIAGNNNGGSPDLTDPCLSVAQGQPVVFHQNPVADAGADADTCGLVITLQGNSGSGIGTWTVTGTPPGSTLDLSGSQNPNSTATASDYGVYTLNWMLDNNGCTDTDTVSLDFNDNPVADLPSYNCDSGNDNYNVTFFMSGGTPGYQVNGTPTGNITGNTFVSDFIPNGNAFSLTITDNAGCESAPVTGAFSCNCATQAGTMDVAQLSACEGGTVSAVHLGGENLDGNDAFGYFLHSGSGAILGTVYASNTTGVFGFQPGMSYGTVYYISYVVGDSLNGMPDPADFCLSVATGQPVVFYLNPVADAGIDQDTCGTLLTLSGNNLPGGSGQWTVSAGNAADLIISNPADPASTVISSQPGAYTLTWTVDQNGCVDIDDVNLQFNDSPTLADIQRVCDALNENYTVTLTIAGGTPPFTVNGTSNAGATFVSPLIQSGQSYSYDVSDANGCSMPTVAGAFSCNCSTSAGTMQTQPISVCQGSTITVTANADQVLDGNDITAYVLHSGTGAALGQVYAQNTTGVFSFQPGMTYNNTYFVSLVAGNPSGTFPNPMDPCFSVAVGQPVIWLANPVPDAGPDDAICADTFGMVAVTSGYPGVWTQVSGPGTATFADATESHSQVNVSVNGSYVFQWTETNGICVADDQVQIDFNATPVVSGLTETCDGTNTAYSVSFSVNGGTPPYTVVGISGTPSGLTFTSDPIASGDGYSFGIADANGCPTPLISGTFICNCTTNAGTMQVTPAVFCANTPATAIWNNDGVTDANDIIRFILHSDPGTAPGTIFATNNQPTFNFSGNLQTGVTYYISAIAGNNSAGNIDLNDPCLSIAPGVPVQWKPMPTATLTGDATICSGSSSVVSFTGTGVYPLTVTYSNGTGQNTLTLTGNQTVTLNVTPTATQTFSLIQVSDGTNPTCTTSLNNSVTVTVNQPVNAGTANEPVQFCFGTNLPIVLSNLITGADAGGQWSETSTVPSTAGAFNANTGVFLTNDQKPGTYTFRYRLTALAPCTSDEETVTVIIHPNPTADAGDNQTINCDQTSVTLGGPNTSPGSYNWSKDNVTIATTPQIIVSEGGLYSLMVTNPAGCTDMDDTNVDVDNQPPVVHKVTVNGIRCYGDHNGSIRVDSITTVHPPLQYSLDGTSYQFSPVFTGLTAGNYTVIIQDANGCETNTGILQVADAQLLTADLGDNITATLSDSVHLIVQSSVAASDLDTIIWNPLLDLSPTRAPEEQHFLPLQSYHIAVTLVDSNGCEARDEILLRLEKPRNIYIPNIFNPANGRDPVLYIYGGRDVEEIESFVIFDRWGTQLFEQKNFQPNDPVYGWDGRFKGEQLNPGVFVYQAVVRFIDKEKILYKGDVTIVR